MNIPREPVPAEPLVPVKVWDGWVRLFHWSVVLLVILSYVTARTGRMWWHFAAGYATLALVLFRIAWGFVGSDTARFAEFLRSPLAAMRYLRGWRRTGPGPEVGHNAAGGWMVLLMIGLLLAMAVTGLFSDDDELFRGPFADWIGFDASRDVTGWHQRLFDVLLGAVALHVVAVTLYRVALGRRLVGPMVTGWTHVPAGSVAAGRPPRMGRPVLGATLLAVAVALVVAFWRLAQP